MFYDNVGRSLQHVIRKAMANTNFKLMEMGLKKHKISKLGNGTYKTYQFRNLSFSCYQVIILVKKDNMANGVKRMFPWILLFKCNALIQDYPGFSI